VTSIDLADPDQRRALLDRHAFHRSSYRPEALGFLLGNAELGGPARADGLGFDSFFIAADWRTPTCRGSLVGPLLTIDEMLAEPQSFSQDLDLATAILTTELRAADGFAYRCELFASQAETALVQFRLTNLGERPYTCRLRLPGNADSRQQRVAADLFHVASGPEAYTPWACAVASDRPSMDDRQLCWSLAPGEQLQLSCACATVYEGPDFAERMHGIAWEQRRTSDLARRAHVATMEALWSASAWVSLPDVELEQLYYRSVYWLLSASGSRHALPQETPLAAVDTAWSGVAFTFGFGWGILAFSLLGHPDRAQRMLRRMYRPAGQARNARTLLDRLPDNDIAFFMAPPSHAEDEAAPPGADSADFVQPGYHASRLGDDEARSFGHQVSIHGDDRMRRGHQRHIDGFATSIAYRLACYHPDDALLSAVIYPMLRGAAIFWTRLVRWDDEAGGYVTPVLHSVSENLDAPNVSDNVLAARWLLRRAAALAERLAVDEDWRARWSDCADGLVLPQNDEIFLEYLGQDGLREGTGYFGVRFPIYFGCPGWELADELDHDKVRRTFAAVEAVNDGQRGMISFIASAFAASAAAYDDAPTWLRAIRRNLQTLDPDSGALQEVEGQRPYFHTSYAAYVAAILSGLLRSDEAGDRLFPGIPTDWTEVAGWNLPAAGGRRVALRRDAAGDHCKPLTPPSP